MTTVLVTGASGFIGRAVVARLSALEAEITSVASANGDIASPDTWRDFAPSNVVVHLAGRTFVPASWDRPADFLQCNVHGTVQALDYCVRHGARLVYVSSYLYGKPDVLPIPESAPLVANTPYALSKKLAEEACEFYARSFGVKVTTLRPFNVYGRGQSDHFLVPSIIRQIRNGREIRVKDLEPKRDYVYVDDVADAIATAVTAGEADEGRGIFNIGSGTSHSVAELIDIVQDAMGSKLPVLSEGQRRKDEVMDTVAAIAEARVRLGWVPQWTLADGIRATARA
jgi:GDP-4-dehydro-6-deoxy-D-mannose reductase